MEGGGGRSETRLTIPRIYNIRLRIQQRIRLRVTLISKLILRHRIDHRMPTLIRLVAVFHLRAIAA